MFSLKFIQKKVPDDSAFIDVKAGTRFNKQVTKIAFNPNEQRTSIRLDCSDNTYYEAEHVICTLPLGVLKECHLGIFDPILPQETIDSIDGLSFGTMNKIYIEWDKQYWPAEKSSFGFLWGPEELKLIHNTLDNWIEGISALYSVENQPNILYGRIDGSKSREMEELCEEDLKKGVHLLIRLFLKQFNMPEPINIIR